MVVQQDGELLTQVFHVAGKLVIALLQESSRAGVGTGGRRVSEGVMGLGGCESTCLWRLEAQKGAGMGVHEELQGTGLQQVARMMQLRHLRYGPHLVSSTLLHHVMHIEL